MKQIIEPYLNPLITEAGCDEAGRGCLAGPVVAAAVILPKDFRHPFLTDSKQLSKNKRDELRKVIEKEAITYKIGLANSLEIDEINILNATFLAMHRAIQNLNPTPDRLIIDGNRFAPFEGIPHTCVIQGDSKFLHIAAASILAKTYRDDFMEELHEKYPIYQWNKNKGYPTRDHRSAIFEHGESEYHRRSFNLIGHKQLSLF